MIMNEIIVGEQSDWNMEEVSIIISNNTLHLSRIGQCATIHCKWVLILIHDEKRFKIK